MKFAIGDTIGHKKATGNQHFRIIDIWAKWYIVETWTGEIRKISARTAIKGDAKEYDRQVKYFEDNCLVKVE